MRLVRTFSTALRRCRQSLYEPYIEPLNKEKKKALRRVIMSDLPDISNRLPRDVQMTLKDHKPDFTLQNQRKATFDTVESLIQSTYGRQFGLMDMSLGQYARDLNVAPLEFAIYDKSQPQGLPPGSESASLDGPYDHNALAKLLLERGFSGQFIDGDALRITRKHAADEYRVEELGNLPEYPGWGDYTRFPITYLSYPPILHVQENRPLLPFYLSPVMPLFPPLLKLLREYLSDPLYKDFVSAIYLWVRSVELHHMSTLCIALLTIHIIQAELRVPSLQTVGPNNEGMDELKNHYDGAWIRAELPPSYPTRLIWIETAHRKFPSEIQNREYKKVKKLLFSFFDTFSTHSQTKPFLSSLKVISIRDAQYLDRKEPIQSRVDRWTPFESKVDAIRIGITRWNPMDQPPEWISQPLVIVDPFLPSFNHARNLSPNHTAYFSRFCSVSRRAMAAGHSYPDLLGPGLGLARGSLSLSSRSYPSTERGRETGEFGLRSYSTSAVDEKILQSISAFGDEASRIYKEIFPPEPVFQARKETIDRVSHVIKNNFGKQFRVRAFGSTEYGVSTAASDLDLIVIDPIRPDGFTKKSMKEKRQPRVYNMMWVGHALHNRGFENVLAIPAATVPIVKFHDPKTGLDCDININDQLGLLNTNLIKAYCDLQPDLVRPMIMTIKRWAKAHDLNDPSGMQGGPISFSSYTLAIMVIGFLQCQGVLPNLQAGLTPLPKKAVEGVFWIRTKKKKKDYSPRQRCDVRWNLPPTSWRPPISMTLGQAIYGWFKFWSKDFDYDAYVLSIRDGGVNLRDLQTLWKRKFGVKVKKKKGKAPTVDPNVVEEIAGEISKLRASPVIQAEVQRLEDDVARREDIEDAAVAALHEMDMELQETNKGEEREVDGIEEDSVMDGPEKPQVIDIAAEEAALSQVKGLVMEDALPPPEAVITGEAAQALVPPLANAEVDGMESDVESVSSSIIARDQPRNWANHFLVVTDPFIDTKNLAGTIGDKQLSRFRMKCQAAMVAIETGESLSEIFPEKEDPLLDDDEIILQGKGRGLLGDGRGKSRGRGVVHIGYRGKPEHQRKQRQSKSEEGSERESNANVIATKGGPSKPKRPKKPKTGAEAGKTDQV